MTIRFDNPLRMVRELKGAPLSIVWVLFYAKQRVSQEFLERSTGYSDKPVSQALAYLEEIGLVNHTRSGWALIQDNQNQLPLPLALEEGHGPADLGPGEPEAQSDPENRDRGSELSRNNSDSLKLEEEVFNLNNLNSSSDSLKAAQVGKIPTIEEIRRVLAAAADLFGHEIVGDPRDYSDLDRLLAWIAQAQDRRGTGRGRVENPAGLVYWAFHKGRDRPPERKYIDLELSHRYLPESFMRSSGQWDFTDDEDDEDDEKEDAKI